MYHSTRAHHICSPLSTPTALQSPIGERPTVLSPRLAELLLMSRAEIGRQLCHSNSKHSPTSSVLLFWCSQGGEGNGSFLCESAELPQPAPYHLSLTYCACTRLSGSCAAHFPPLAPLCLCLCEQLHFVSFKSFTLCGAVSFYLWCFSGVARRGEEHLSPAGGALMGGIAGSGWDWGC